MKASIDIFSRKETRFDEVFEEIFSSAKKIDQFAKLVVYCECANCERCKPGVHICEKTRFFTSENKKIDNLSIHKYEKIYHLYTSDQSRIYFKICIYSEEERIKNFLSSIRPSVIREMSRISNIKLMTLRDAVVESSLVSTDSNSFCYRALKRIQEISPFDGGSIFIQDTKTEKIELSATTGIQKLSDRDLFKKDIFYFPDRGSYTSVCFRSNSEIFEESETGLIENTFGENIRPIRNRTYFPIQLRRRSTINQLLGAETIGVLRIVNIRKNGNIQPPTKHDSYLFEYFCEFVCILAKLYQNASNPFGVLERATHGFIHDLSILSGRVGMFDQTSVVPFFSEASRVLKEKNVNQEVNQKLSELFRRYKEEYELFRNDILGVVESMAAQLHSVLDTTNFSAGRPVGPRDQKTTHPYREVFVRLKKAAPFMARSHNKTAPKIIISAQNGSVDYRYMPALNIDPEVLYLVMRNLLENSIKYQTNDTHSPQVEICWVESDNLVSFDFSDDGVGIEGEEERYLFRMGFRGRKAVLMSTRGNGIGLAFIREAIEAFEGTIEFTGTSRSGQGCNFAISVRKA